MRFEIIAVNTGLNEIYVNNNVEDYFPSGGIFDLINQQTLTFPTPSRFTVVSSSFGAPTFPGGTTIVISEPLLGSVLDPLVSLDSYFAVVGHYVVNFSDNTKTPFDIVPYTVDSGTLPTGHTSLVLPGRGSINYGELLTENLVHILENFSNDSPPPHPLEGQIWFDSSSGMIMVYKGGVWVSIDAVFTGSTPPLSPVEGQLWYDNSIITDRPQLMVYDGTTWKSVADYYVLKSGDTMTGSLNIQGDTTYLITKDSIGNERIRIGGTGDTNIEPDIKIHDSALVVADNSVTIIVDGDNDTTGNFVIAKGAYDTSSSTNLVVVHNTGEIRSSIANYETLVTDNNSIPNKKYVDDSIDNVAAAYTLDNLADVDTIGKTNGSMISWNTSLGLWTVVPTPSGPSGVTDHGLLNGLSDDDHTLYALADGSRGDFAALGHTHPYLPLTGGTLTGDLTLPGNPSDNLHATTKFYVDNAIIAGTNGYLPLSGGVLTGDLILHADPISVMGAATKQYVDQSLVGVAKMNETNTWTKAQSGAFQTLISVGGIINTDLSTSNNYVHQLTENTTLASPTNATPGQSGMIEFNQDAVTPRTLTFSSFWKFVGGVVPSLTNVVSSKDVLSYVINADGLSATCAMLNDIK